MRAQHSPCWEQDLGGSRQAGSEEVGSVGAAGGALLWLPLPTSGAQPLLAAISPSPATVHLLAGETTA